MDPFHLFLNYMSSRYFLSSFESIGSGEGQIDFQNDGLKIVFQDGRNRGHVGFSIRTILAIFNLLVAPILPTKFRVNYHSV